MTIEQLDRANFLVQQTRIVKRAIDSLDCNAIEEAKLEHAFSILREAKERLLPILDEEYIKQMNSLLSQSLNNVLMTLENDLKSM